MRFYWDTINYRKDAKTPFHRNRMKINEEVAMQL